MANAGLLNPFGNGGRTDNSAYYSNLDKNLVLSASDMGKTVTITKSNGYGVVLPDARQLIKNVNINIVNMSTVAISIFNNNGFILKVLPIKQQITCKCTDKSSSSGTWTVIVVGSSLFRSIGSNSNPTYIANGATTNNVYNQVCMLTSTIGIGISVQPWNLYVSVLQINGSTITHLTTSTIAWGPDISWSIDVLDSTKAIFAWSNTWTTTSACLIIYSSPTLTITTATTISSTYGGFGGLKLCSLSPTTAAISLSYASGNNYPVVHARLTISGTTITLDGVVTSVSTSAASKRLINMRKLTADTALVMYYSPVYAFVLSNISGSGSLVANAQVLIDNVDVSLNVDFTVLTSSLAIACFKINSSLVARKIVLSGTTITDVGGTTNIIINSSAIPFNISMCTVSQDTVIAQYGNSAVTPNTLEVISISISGSSVNTSNVNLAFNGSIGYTYSGTTYTGDTAGWNGISTVNSTTALSYFSGPTSSKVSLANVVLIS